MNSDFNPSIPPPDGKPPSIQPEKPSLERGHRLEQGEKKLLTMNLTEEEYDRFLDEYVKTMLNGIKKDQARQMAALKRLNPENEPP